MAEDDKKTDEQQTPTEEKAEEQAAEPVKAEETPAEEKKEEDPTEEKAEESKEKAEESATEEEAPAETEEKTEEVPAEVETEEVKAEEAAQEIVPGMIVRVHLKIKDVTPRGDERERIQIFEGTVIGKKGKTRETATITVRKVSKGFGVERIFPLAMPTIDKIEVVKQLRVRRSKLYFLRGKYKKRIKEVLTGKK